MFDPSSCAKGLQTEKYAPCWPKSVACHAARAGDSEVVLGRGRARAWTGQCESHHACQLPALHCAPRDLNVSKSRDLTKRPLLHTFLIAELNA